MLKIFQHRENTWVNSMKIFVKLYVIAHFFLFGQSCLCMQKPSSFEDNLHISGFDTLMPLAEADATVTPLHRAAGNGDVAAVRQLLEANAHIDARNARGETPLHYAARGGHVEVAQLLLECQCSTQDISMNDLHNMHVNAIEESPMHVAASHDRLDFVRFLIGQGVHTDGRTSNAHLPLHYAAYAGTEESAQAGELFKRTGIDIYATELQANTPLHIAAFYGREPFVKFLLTHHAPVYLRNLLGQTALHLAAIRGHDRIVGLLLQRNQVIDIRTIHEVAVQGRLDILNMLLMRSTTPNKDIEIQVDVSENQQDVNALPDVKILLTMKAKVLMATIPITAATYEAPSQAQQQLVKSLSVFDESFPVQIFDMMRPLFNALMFFVLNLNTVSQMQPRKPQ